VLSAKEIQKKRGAKYKTGILSVKRYRWQPLVLILGKLLFHNDAFLSELNKSISIIKVFTGVLKQGRVHMTEFERINTLYSLFSFFQSVYKYSITIKVVRSYEWPNPYLAMRIVSRYENLTNFVTHCDISYLFVSEGKMWEVNEYFSVTWQSRRTAWLESFFLWHASKQLRSLPVSEPKIF
jgi:hypothetical protein